MNPKHPKNKKILIMAGVAGGLLALIVLLKSKQSSAAAGATPEGQTLYSSAPASIPAGSGEGAGASQQYLAAWGESLREQLPGAISSGIAAGLANNAPASSPGSNSLVETISALSTFASSLPGQQVGAGTGSPSSPAPVAVEAAHPVASSPAPPVVAKPTPPKPPGIKIVKCGNGCEGHRHPDGHTACQLKDKKGRCYWP